MPGTLTITRSLLTVTANDATREYGLANPAFTGNITGFRNSDTASVVSGLVYNTVADINSNAGTYGIIGAFAGVPLGFAVAIALPGDPEVSSGAAGALVAAVWSMLWFRRTKSGIAIAAVVLELALFVMLVGDASNITMETAGIVLCVLGIVAAIASIIGRLKPSLPPLVASLIVIGWGCIAQNTYGGDVIAVIGIVISAVLFLIAYRRSEALMSAATAVSTGVWAVVLTAALTEGSLVPLVVAAALGAAMIAWGAKLTRK